MAQTSAERVRFGPGSESSPILFKDGQIRVYRNPTREVFVEDIRSGATMRVSSYSHGDGLQFTTDSRVEPIQVNGMIGWRVSPR